MEKNIISQSRDEHIFLRFPEGLRTKARQQWYIFHFHIKTMKFNTNKTIVILYGNLTYSFKLPPLNTQAFKDLWGVPKGTYLGPVLWNVFISQFNDFHIKNNDHYYSLTKIKANLFRRTKFNLFDKIPAFFDKIHSWEIILLIDNYVLESMEFV